MLLPDISEFQPYADLVGIKKQNGGAIILRVCYGDEHTDKNFVSHRAAAERAGFRFIGLYQYVVESQDIKVQAREFIRLVGSLKPGEIPILDLEEGDGDQSERASEWLVAVDDAFGLNKLALNRRSWLYTGENYGREHGLTQICDSARHTWVAKYSNAAPTLGHTLWQCTDGGTGINRVYWAGASYCDTNVTSYNLDQLAATAAR